MQSYRSVLLFSSLNRVFLFFVHTIHASPILLRVIVDCFEDKSSGKRPRMYKLETVIERALEVQITR